MRRILTSVIYISSLLAAVVLWPIPLMATNYTVKSGGGGNFTTIQACANVAVAGDTCQIYAGSYTGWTQTTSGSAGSPITFTVNPGDSVTITSSITVTNTNYITIGAPDAGGGCANNATNTGAGGANPTFTVGGCFVFIGGAIVGPTPCSGKHTNHFHLTYNTQRGSNPPTLVHFDESQVPGFCGPVDTKSNDNYFAHNKVDWNIDYLSGVVCNEPFFVFGDRNLFEYNDVQGTRDIATMGGSNDVMRFNWHHDNNMAKSFGCRGAGLADHESFWQGVGSDGPTPAFILLENNIERNCSNDQGNCHFAQDRAGGGYVGDTIIVRYNYVQQMDFAVGGIGDHTDGSNTTPNAAVYNNTFAPEGKSTFAGCFVLDSTGGAGSILNNICYNSTASGASPFYFNLGGPGNGNLSYNTDCTTTCTWAAPYANEATFNTLKNKNPLFANYPTDGSLQSGSPARGAGVALTAVSSGCGTTSLTVGNAHFFQPGWGPSDKSIPGDWIRVGSSTTVQILGVNYSTNTLTLANSISCSPSDPVYLYKITNGTIVLAGGNPEIGAYPYTGGTPQPSPPTGLTAVVN